MIRTSFLALRGRLAVPAVGFDVSGPLAVVITAILGVLVLTPLGWLLYTSLTTDKGVFTIQNFVTVFTTQRYLSPIGNSLIVATAVGSVSVLLAAPAAWAVARTDLALRGLFRLLIIGSYATPPFLGALAWILLAGPNAGLINKAIVAMTGASSGLFNIYSMPGLIFVLMLYQYPFCFLLISSMLQAIPSDIEDAANISGASTVRTALTITLPLAAPAVIGGFIVSFLETISIFGSPAMIAIPARFHVITTQIYALFQFPQRVEVGAAMALPLLVLTAVLLLVQQRFLRRKGYALVAGKGGARRVVRLGRLQYVFVPYCALLVICSLILPTLVLLRAAFSKAWGAGFEPSNLTLENFRFVLFSFQATREALTNSLSIAAMTATAAAVLTALAAYISLRQLVRGHRLLPLLAMTPVVIPGIVMAIGIFSAYSRPPIFLYGTIWILFVAYLTKFLPVAFTSSQTALRSIHPELEEAARIAGGSRLRVFRDIVAPLMKNGIAAAWILVFIVSMRELSSSILLYTARSRVVAVAILDLQSEGRWELAAVMGILLLILTFGVIGIGYRVLGRDFLEARG